MTTKRTQDAMSRRYVAFVSYAHGDEQWARWLQRSLERFRIPRHLKHEGTSAPRRLHPIFRDKDDLASSASLPESIRSALAQSEFLIIVCSPRSAGSRWVNEEIRLFQELNDESRVLCLLVDGTTAPDDDAYAFPPALTQADDGSHLAEPLAADVRPLGDGRRDALLKIAAGLLGVQLDELKRRDARRRLRFRTAIAASSLIVSVVTVGFAIAALLAREEAELRRSQAEQLISFMLEDLRKGLEPVGRLDLLDAVGDEAMNYFEVLGNRGSEQEVLSRAIALRQIGEVRFRRGLLDGAGSAFEESRNITASLLRESPENLSYLFELGQAEFWIGYAAHEQSLLESSRESYLRYLEISRVLLEADPQNPDYQMEMMYAHSNLGSWELDNENAEGAIVHLRMSLDLNQSLVDAHPEDEQLQHELANTYSWLGELESQLGNLDRSQQAYQAAVDNLQSLHERNRDRLASEHFGQNLYHLGNVLMNQGDIRRAERLYRQSLQIFDQLVEFDEENTIWRSDRGIASYHLAETLWVTERRSSARTLLDEAIQNFSIALQDNPNDYRIVEYMVLAEQLLALDILTKSEAEAIQLSRRSQARLAPIIDSDDIKPRSALNIAKAGISRGIILWHAGDEPGAEATWRESLNILERFGSESLPHLALKQQLHQALGESEAVASIERHLDGSLFDDPRTRITAVASR